VDYGFEFRITCKNKIERWKKFDYSSNNKKSDSKRVPSSV